MTRQRIARLWQIGWVIACGVPVFLIIVLWVRSYVRYDLLGVRIAITPIEVISAGGRVKITRAKEGAANFNVRLATFKTDDSQGQTLSRHLERFDNTLGLGLVNSGNPAFLLPYWLLTILVATTCCAASTIRWSGQFSMRTMLIATAVVAIGSLLTAWLL